jgi:uncharacterized protein
MITYPNPGFGLGLRTAHYEEIAGSRPQVDWFEFLTENYLVAGGRPMQWLDGICRDYPVVMHGVSLSIASTDPLDLQYLQAVKQLAGLVSPLWISDHLCWTGIAGKNLHDLLPFPYTEAALRHVTSRVAQVQEILGRRIVLENVSSYVEFKEADMTEWQFLAEVAKRSDCLLLLDVNNVYVSAYNHGFDPHLYLQGVPARPRAADTPGRPQPLRGVHHRHARRGRDRRGLAALCGCGRAIRSGGDDDRAGRPHPTAGGAVG